jgi:hypothetical protein
MNTIKSYINTAAQWVAANPTNVVYVALIVAGFTVVSGAGRRR